MVIQWHFIIDGLETSDAIDVEETIFPEKIHSISHVLLVAITISAPAATFWK